MHTAGAHGIPHAFVVDKSGSITYSGHPAAPDFEAALQRAVASTPATVEKQALPLITELYEELMARSAKVRGSLARSCTSLPVKRLSPQAWP